MAAAGRHFHAAFGRQRCDFAGKGAGVAVTNTELTVQIVAPGPDAVAGAHDQRVFGAARHADDGLSEVAHGADGKEVSDVAVSSL